MTAKVVKLFPFVIWAIENEPIWCWSNLIKRNFPKVCIYQSNLHCIGSNMNMNMNIVDRVSVCVGLGN